MPTGRSRITHKKGSASIPTPQDLAYDVACILGVFETGPLERTGVNSYAEFQKKYGGNLAGYYSPITVKNMFGDGAQRGIKRLLVKRIVHMTGASPASAAKGSTTFSSASSPVQNGRVTGTISGPWSIDHGETIVASVDGGADLTATFSAVAATLLSNGSGPYVLWDGATLSIAVDGGATQTVTFQTADFANIAAATATEVAQVINNQASGVTATVVGDQVRLTSNRKGTGSYLNIVEVGAGIYGTDANSVLQFNVATVQGTGDCSDSQSVTFSEVQIWLAAALVGTTISQVTPYYLRITTNTVGSAGSIQIQASSTADTSLGLDNLLHEGVDAGAQQTLTLTDLYYGSRALSAQIASATDGVAGHFDVLIFLNGIQVERFSNCSMDSTSTAGDYVLDKINNLSGRSDYVAATDLLVSGTWSQARPANTSATAFSGGADGLSGLASTDFIGSSTYRTGLYSFNGTTEGDILVCPDDTSETFQDAATAYCEDADSGKAGRLIFVPEVPVGSDYAAAAAHADSITQSDARLAHLWPWVTMANPDTTVYGLAQNITVPPCGFYVARMAANSRKYKEQMAKQPGNHIFGALDQATGLETLEVMDPDVRDFVTDHLINPIVAGYKPGTTSYGVWVDDVQSGDPTGDWRTVGNVRFVAYIKGVLENYMAQFRTQGNTVEARKRQRKGIDGYLLQWLGREVFASAAASDAFYVDTDIKGETINNPQVQAAQKFVWNIGLALAEAGRFGEITIARDTRALEAYVQQQLAS